MAGEVDLLCKWCVGVLAVTCHFLSQTIKSLVKLCRGQGERADLLRRRGRGGEEWATRRGDENKVKHDEWGKRERTPWETEKRARWVLTGEGGCLLICLHQNQVPVGIITGQAHTHTHAHTQAHTHVHTQMHSDNPSALAKCCLIQPDLHSTEKANSLPLTVWKTERSSHKWQRSELPRLCVCVCVFVCPLACTCAHTPQLMFLFLRWFFQCVCACVFTCIGGDNLFSSTPLHCVTGR